MSAAVRHFAVSHADVEFVRRDGVPLFARLYRPHGPGPFPGIVDVHGGAWCNQDRTRNEAIDEELAAAGIVVMSIDFRMPPLAAYPASVADVNAATRWLKSEGATVDVDPERVGGLGISTGGHLVMLSGMRPFDARYLGEGGDSDTDARLAFAVVCYGIVDPLARYRLVRDRATPPSAPDAQLVGNHEAYFGSEAVMAEANPKMILDRYETIELPPVLYFQGSADEMVTSDMAESFASSYRAAGGSIDLVTFPGAPHTFLHQDPGGEASREAMRQITDFVCGI